MKEDGALAFFGRDTPLLNFYPSPMEIDQKQWRNVEEYYQTKAVDHSNDDGRIAKQIRSECDPGQIKKLSRSVKTNETWITLKDGVMRSALEAKFGSSAQLKDYLLKTGEKELLEASQYDRYWGTGVPLRSKEVFDKKGRVGQNRLGLLLMEVQKKLRDCG